LPQRVMSVAERLKAFQEARASKSA
jgi:hypothetical protein